MLKNIPIEKILLTALSNGGEFAELYAERTVSTSILHEDKKLERANTGIDTGYGLRVLFEDKTAYGFTNDPDKLMEVAAVVGKSIRGKCSDIQLLKAKNSKIQPLNVQLEASEDLALPVRASRSPHFYEEFKRKADIVKRAASEAWAHNHIKQVQTTWRDMRREIFIVNSRGIEEEDLRIDSVMLVLVIAEKNGLVQTGYEPAGGGVGIEYFLKEPPEKIAKSAAERALLMLRANHSPRGVMPVVISSSAGGTMIHEAVGHGLEGDLVRQGMSVYKNKIGKKVASSLITVIDDATLPSKRGSSKFDDEGTPAQKTTLIENGVLKTYLHNHITAAAAGVKSTGNGRRESYRNRPVVRMTNTMVASGLDNPESNPSSLNI